MKVRPSKCRNCARLAERVAELERQLAAALTRIEPLEKQLASARKDSSTSSKPPSSDIVKPPKPPRQAAASGKRKRRRRGGQPGHARHERKSFGPEEVDHTIDYELTDDDAAGLRPLVRWQVIQQVDLVDKPFVVTEHRARRYLDRRTGRIVTTPLPREITAAGLIGPRLSALIAYQKGACHMSYRVIAQFFGDVLRLPLSTGQLAKVTGKASDALAACYTELEAALPRQPVLNVDETGHPENGDRLWNWGFHAPGPSGFTWFHIDPSRGCGVLKEFLGETFRGVVGCDYHGAYRKFLRETDAVLQFCWAHLIRDVKFLTTLSDPVTRRYGERLLRRVKTLFRTWHRRGRTPAKRWQPAADRARRELLQVARRAPRRSQAQNLAVAKRRMLPSGFGITANITSRS
jgi:transposase